MWGKSFKSYNSTTLAATAYVTRFHENDNRTFQAGSSAVFVDRGARAPSYATQSRRERYITMTVKVLDTASVKTLTDSLLDLFDTADDSLAQLVVTDTAARDWYVDAKVTGHIADGPIHKVTFAAPDGIWFASSATTAATWAATATAATNDYTVGGTHPAKPVIVLTPTSVRASGDGFAYRRFVTIYNNIDVDFVDYPVNVVATTLDTAALVTAGKMQADGDDLRVYVDGKKTARWLSGINTVDTKVWINLDLDPAISALLEGALGVGAITTIDFEQTKASRIALRKLPKRGTLLIESELFTYTGVEVDDFQVTGVQRAMKGTTAATHTDGQTVRWIQHDIWFVYGNAAIAAPSQSNKTKPMINLTSTNTEWDWDEFLAYDNLADLGDDPTSKRTAQWIPALLKTTGGKSEIYTGDEGAQASPATEMGMHGEVWRQGSQYRSERYRLAWSLYHPAGVTTAATMDGESYTAATADWADKALLQVSKSGGATAEWIDTAITVAAPATAATWTAWVGSGALGATYNYLRMLFAGTLAAASGKEVSLDVKNITLTLDSAQTPTVTLGAEQSDAYRFQCTLKNTTTGEKFSLDYVTKLNESFTVNCLNKTVRHSDEGDCFGSLTLDTAQNEWMTLIPGTNVLKITEVGIVGMNIDVSWTERDGGF